MSCYALETKTYILFCSIAMGALQICQGGASMEGDRSGVQHWSSKDELLYQVGNEGPLGLPWGTRCGELHDESSGLSLPV